jgi:hypothetical protein
MLLRKGFDNTSAAFETVEQEMLKGWVAEGREWDARYQVDGEPDPEDPHGPALKPLSEFFEEVIWPYAQEAILGDP